MAEDLDISLGNLDLDLENYRIGRQEDPRAAIKAMLADQETKLGRLAADILDEGLNPTKRLMVTRQPDKPERYRVLEGNRRVTAMKLIMNPTLAEGTPYLATFKRLYKRKSLLPKLIKCTVLTPEKAFIWREREHVSGQNGVGIEPWGRLAKIRAMADQGKQSYSHDVLEFVLSNPDLDQDVREKIEGRKFKVTNLERLINSGEVRNELGLNGGEERLQCTSAKPWLQDVLTRIVEIVGKEKDTDGKKFTVKTIYDQKAQVSFVKRIAKQVVTPRAAAEVWPVGADSPSDASVKPQRVVRKKPNPSSQERKTLVPPRSEPIASTGRANDIYIELRHIHFSDFPNAIAILFRVFIEFSVDHFIGTHAVGIGVDKELKKKIAAVATYMEQNSLLTRKELLPVNNMVGTLGEVVSTVTLNAYVHNQKAFPSPEELRISWDRIEHFLRKVWQ